MKYKIPSLCFIALLFLVAGEDLARAQAAYARRLDRQSWYLSYARGSIISCGIRAGCENGSDGLLNPVATVI